MDPTFFIDDYTTVLSNRQGSTVPTSDLKMTDAMVDDFLNPDGSNPASSLARMGGGGLAMSSSSRPDLESTGTFLTSIDEAGTYFSNLKTPGMRLERPISTSAQQLNRVTDLMVAMSGGADGGKDDSSAGDAGVMRLEQGGDVFTPTLGGRLDDMPSEIGSVASADGAGARYEGITNTSLDNSWISSPPASEPLRSGSQVRRLQEMAQRPKQSPNARRSLNLPQGPQPPPRGRSRRPNSGQRTTNVLTGSPL